MTTPRPTYNGPAYDSRGPPFNSSVIEVGLNGTGCFTPDVTRRSQKPAARSGYGSPRSRRNAERPETAGGSSPDGRWWKMTWHPARFAGASAALERRRKRPTPGRESVAESKGVALAEVEASRWHRASGHDSESEPGGEAKDDSMKRTKSGSRALLVWSHTARGNGSEKKVCASAEMLP